MTVQNHCKFLIISSIVLFIASISIRNAHSQCLDTLDLGNDTSFCNQQSFLIDAGNGYLDYLWSTGQTTSSILVNSTANYSCTVHFFDSTNLVVNGDFSLGNVFFTSSYNLGIGGSWGQLSNEGTYAISTNASLTHNYFSPCTDHPTGTGNMLVVNGASVLSQAVWSQVINVNPNTEYNFSAWFTAVHSSNPAILSFTINGVQIGANASVSNVTCNWQNFFTSWNSGSSTTAAISITNQNTGASGNDFAIDDIYFAQICTFTDSIDVTFDTQPDFNLGNDTVFCDGDSLLLHTNILNANYLWSNGSTDSSIYVTTSGHYWANVITSSCIDSDSINIKTNDCNCDIFIPNIFTPNGDEFNESFRAVIGCELDMYRMRIFNRWGELVFESEDQNEVWDGKYQGKEVTEGVYFYKMDFLHKKTNPNEDYQTGSITLLR
jgi:gliding motility-associated-like protein